MKKRSLLLNIIFSFLCLNLFSNINLPESFGKTNFIVGLDSKTIINKSHKSHKSHGKSCAKNSIEEILKPGKHGIRQALFAPDDKVLEALISLIDKEKTSIRMAAFLLTDYNIVKALLDANLRGVQVEIVFDSSAVQKRNIKRTRLLKGRGVKIFVYKAPSKYANKNMSNIMHNKFIVFGENIFGKSLLWTGSFNFTYSAHKCNQENVVILDDQKMISKFIKRFDYLKNKCCYAYGKIR